MAEELIGYYCSGMCNSFVGCTGRAHESGNVQSACGSVWISAGTGDPLHQAVSQFFALMPTICNDINKGCQKYKPK
ncbi:MAG: hypothetical protein KatS3mg112_0617 [Thermogutta sp.]|nr:MAG: hypothetical protein KatS3mg112_0617 [Thermogutta sp.]